MFYLSEKYILPPQNEIFLSTKNIEMQNLNIRFVHLKKLNERNAERCENARNIDIDVIVYKRVI